MSNQPTEQDRLRDPTTERLSFTDIENEVFSQLCIAVVMHPNVEVLVEEGKIDPLYSGDAKQRILIDRTKAIMSLFEQHTAKAVKEAPYLSTEAYDFMYSNEKNALENLEEHMNEYLKGTNA